MIGHMVWRTYTPDGRVNLRADLVRILPASGTVTHKCATVLAGPLSEFGVC